MSEITKKLNEEEKEIYEIVGEENFIKIQKRFGGFSIYFSKAHHKKVIRAMLDEGKSKREICLDLRMSETQFYNVLNERDSEK